MRRFSRIPDIMFTARRTSAHTASITQQAEGRLIAAQSTAASTAAAIEMYLDAGMGHFTIL